MADLFPFARRTAPTARPTRAALPRVAAVRFAGGLCTAACMYALGPDCDCYCNGSNHQSGLRCDGFTQEGLKL